MRNIPSEWKSQCKVSEAGEKAGEPPRSLASGRAEGWGPAWTVLQHRQQASSEELWEPLRLTEDTSDTVWLTW